MQQLCVPDTGTCLDAEGGYCNLVSANQPCARTNGEGTCTGDRICQADEQFSACEAAAPQCLGSCSDSAPSGCTESYCPSAVDTPQSCGSCGAACPGLAYNGTNDNVTCDGGGACTFSCMGEDYDVNNDPSDGCEVTDSPQGNHTSPTATNEGSLGSCDGSSGINVSGILPSDQRQHTNPSVGGFDPNSGSAPDWFTVVGTGAGALCQNDAQLTLQMSSQFPTCYELTFYSPPYTYPPPLCDSNSAGTCTCVASSSGSCATNPGDNDNYNDGDVIYWVISKICSTSSIEDPSYSVTGHL